LRVGVNLQTAALAAVAPPVAVAAGSVQVSLTAAQIVASAKSLTYTTRKLQSSGWGLLHVQS
jgi:hypothetical protein